jgi:hypothetical protein
MDTLEKLMIIKDTSNFEIGTPIQFKKENIDEWQLAQRVGAGGDRPKGRLPGGRKRRNTCGDRIVRKVIASESRHILRFLNSSPTLYRGVPE